MLTTRRARPEDDARLLAIDRQTWTSDVSPAPLTEPGPATFFGPDAVLDDVLVAESDGEVLGYVRLHQPMAIPSHAHVLEVNGLAVDPARQRTGAGRALVEAAVAEARARGARKLSLRVLGPNTPARRLYESCGFTVEGLLHEEFLLDGRLVDDVLMARSLTEPPA